MECSKCGLDVLDFESVHLDPETLTPCPGGGKAAKAADKAESKPEPKAAEAKK